MRLGHVFCVMLGACMVAAASDPGGVSGLPLDRISSGGLMLLDRNGSLVRAPQAPPRKATLDESLEAGLDPRVGPNVRLGDDPPALPADMRAQAEPHLARHPLNPDVLLATFQEGRFTTGGAVNCGYSVSTNGGITWSRALVSSLTTNLGGTYFRATDPVAGVDLQGNFYLNNLGALDNTFATSALLISRSTNGGANFDPPVEIVHPADVSVFIDKNWMAINTFSNTPTAGRIVSTFTVFQNVGHPLGLSYSDDQGQTWSAWKYVTPWTASVPFYAQGSQPLFLPSGKLALVYWNFGWNQHPFESIEVVVSTNGSDSFQYSNRVAAVTRYDTPDSRDGTFLPSAVGNRTDDSIYVVYQALHELKPRILFTKSPDAGRTWTAPLPINDNPGQTTVFNPAISTSGDGQQISVIFYDGRINPANPYLVDIFLAQSFDGGTSWQPNMRLTTTSSDMRLAPLASGGYMLGDYQGLVAGEATNVPSIALFIDTRTGSPDPFVARVGATPSVTFQGWRAARFSLAEIESGQAGPEADADQDGTPNALEYGLGMDPRRGDRPVIVPSLVVTNAAQHFTATYERLRTTTDLSLQWLGSTDLASWTPVTPESETSSPSANPQTTLVTSRFSHQGTPGFYVRPHAVLQPKP